MKIHLEILCMFAGFLIDWRSTAEGGAGSGFFDHHVIPSCPEEAEVCEFQFRVSYNWTMMRFIESGRMNPVRCQEDGTMRYRWKNCSDDSVLTESETDSLMVGDGTHKMVMAINGQLPSPPMVIYENQEVKVTLYNDLVNEVVTLHYHGLEQRGSPWMDGVLGVTQCPVAPGQSFIYRFKASPKGTHWYHAHSGPQRSMGLAGPLIVLPRKKPPKPTDQADDAPSDFNGDYIIMIQDWMHDHSREIYHRLKYDLLRFPWGFSQDKCYGISTQADGLQVGVTPFVSGIINGKGRLYNRTANEPLNRGLPLETFRVRKGQKYRFRLIVASMTFAFRVSIDQHSLHVIASDGGDLREITVESIIANPGERYDFWIEANDPFDQGSYWIRAVNLEYAMGEQLFSPGHVEAILTYEGSLRGEPNSTRTACTPEVRCRVLNCPFRNFASNLNATCVPINELRSKDDGRALQVESQEKFTEYFLNFHFSGNLQFGAFKPNINGRIHVPSSMPHLIYPDHPLAQPCSEKCDEDACYCTHIQKLPLGHVIQLVIFTHLPSLEDHGITGTVHPIHIHGHHVEVVKVGFPFYNASTGYFEANNPDILCLHETCNSARWRNASWEGGNVPDLITENPVRKDTFLIPAGGYVVVRFKADNPGFWYFHCHVEYHNEIGMAMIFQEGDMDQIPRPPKTMRVCGDFTWSRQEFLDAVNDPQPPGTPFEDPPLCDLTPLRIAFTVVCVLSAALAFSAIQKLVKLQTVPC